MKLCALMPVRNEAHILGLSARVALEWCDTLILLIHGTADKSPDIALDLQSEYGIERVRIIFHEDQDWNEMQHRQRMLVYAREFGATHMAIVDADEILTGNLLTTIRHTVEGIPSGRILHLPGYNLRGSLCKYHSSGIWGNRTFSFAFRDRADLCWKGDGFHHRHPWGEPELRPVDAVAQGSGGIMHLWGCSERRLIAKHALYKMTERLRFPNKDVGEIDRMYSWWRRQEGRSAPWEYAQTPAEWWSPYEKWMQYLEVEAEPWQEKQCVELMKQHGPVTFGGMDLFGVV